MSMIATGLIGLLLGMILGFRRGREYGYDVNRGRRVAWVWRILA